MAKIKEIQDSEKELLPTFEKQLAEELEKKQRDESKKQKSKSDKEVIVSVKESEELQAKGYKVVAMFQENDEEGFGIKKHKLIKP